MTASSDTLHSPEPPSPAAPLSPLGRDLLVHTGRGLRSDLDCLAEVVLSFCHALAGYTHLVRLHGAHHQSTVQVCSVVSVKCTMSAEPQPCVCVFIRGDSSAQWNKDAVNHNQMGVCAGGGGEGDLR